MGNEMNDSTVDDFLDRWHRMVRERDTSAIADLLAEDVKLGAPPYWGTLEGRDLVTYLLTLIIQTIDGFTYHREWRNGAELALEFKGTVGGKNVQGIDLITVDSDGRVAAIDVPMRPINTVCELRDKIGPLMEKYFKDLAESANKD